MIQTSKDDKLKQEAQSQAERIINEALRITKALSKKQNMNNLEESVLHLIDALGGNVKSIKYDTDADQWTIVYKNKLASDVLDVDDFINFIDNAL